MKRYRKRYLLVSIFLLWLTLYSCVYSGFLAKDDLKFVQDTGIRKHLRIDGFYMPEPDSINGYYRGKAFIFYEDGSILGAYASSLREALDSPHPARSIRHSFYGCDENGVYSIIGDTITANIYHGFHHIHSMSRIKIKVIDSIHIVKYIEEYFMDGTQKTGERAIETPYHFVHLDTLPPSFMYIKEREELWDDKFEYIRFMNSNGKRIKHKKE